MTITYVNGKFLAQRLTGVQRAAREWLSAVDRLLCAEPSANERWVVLHPPQARAPALRAIETRSVGRPGMPLHWWEQWTLPRAARAGLLLNLAGSAPWFGGRQIATLHDAAVWDQPQAYTWVFRLWYRALFRRLGRGAVRLLTVSEFSRSRLAVRLGLPPQRISVLRNGANHLAALREDADLLDRLGLSGRPFLLAVASANPSKNLARLVAAYAQAGLSGRADLVLVGGTNGQVFASAALPAVKGVRSLGPLDDAGLKALYGGAVALVQPSLYEGFGLPPLEAMACGCAVAAARAAALPEVCGEAATYFDPLSEQDMALAMRRLVQDEGLREGLRRAGRARAATFSWDAAARQLREEVRCAA